MLAHEVSSRSVSGQLHCRSMTTLLLYVYVPAAHPNSTCCAPASSVTLISDCWVPSSSRWGSTSVRFRAAARTTPAAALGGDEADSAQQAGVKPIC